MARNSVLNELILIRFDANERYNEEAFLREGFKKIVDNLKKGLTPPLIVEKNSLK